MEVTAEVRTAVKVVRSAKTEQEAETWLQTWVEAICAIQAARDEQRRARRVFVKTDPTSLLHSGGE